MDSMVVKRRTAMIAAAAALALTCAALAIGLLLADGSSESSAGSRAAEAGEGSRASEARDGSASKSASERPDSSPERDQPASSSSSSKADGQAAPGAAGPAFPPARGAGGSATVWAVGDVEPSDSGRRVARLVKRGRPTRFLYLGDVYESGTLEEFRTEYDFLYRGLRAITAPTPGNHDWPNHGEGYDPYWRRAFGRPVRDHYSFRLAGWQLISLNSEAVESDQIRWLRSRVAGGGDCRIAFYHRPRFSAGSHGDQEQVEPFWQALRGRARLVLNAHDHNMQQLRRRDGITELIVGSGGHSNYPVDEGDPRLAWSNDSDWGALRMTLRPGRADFAFVGLGGEVLRRGSATCTG
jgi:acid phosphatase type 7